MRLDRRVRLVSAVLGAMLLAVSHQDPVHGIDCVGFPSITSYPGGTGLHAVVVVDVNGDGKLDIVAATQDGARVLLGNGNGTFGDGVNYGPAAGSVAAADLNGDGHVDLALTPAAPTQTQAAIVLLGNGDGAFGAPASFASGIAQVVIKIADVDQNGTADLVLVGGGGSPIGNRNASVLLGAGNGTFAAPATYNAGTDPMALVMADFNGDGYPDIATATADHITHVAIVLNRKDGTFGPGKPYNPFGLLIGIGSIAPADFNNDGKIDLLFSHPTGILMGVGDGTFTSDGTQYDGSEPAAAGDLNGDGFADAIVSNGSDGVDVLLGNGDGTLGPPASFVIGARPGDLALGISTATAGPTS